MSKEHLWAKWMRDYLPRGPNTQQIGVRNFETGARHTQPGPLDVKGDARSQKLKVVCETCNNNWMSQLQALAKPVLLPLIKGESQIIRGNEREILAIWATMFALVYETTAVDYPISPNVERADFKRTKCPLPYWAYWCGAFDGLSSPAYHIGVFAQENVGPVVGVENATDAPRVHLTLFGAGKICFAVFGANSHDGLRHFAPLIGPIVTRTGMMVRESLGRPRGFFQLWPALSGDIDLTALRTPSFSEADLFLLSSEVGYALDTLLGDVHGRR